MFWSENEVIHTNLIFQCLGAFAWKDSKGSSNLNILPALRNAHSEISFIVAQLIVTLRQPSIILCYFITEGIYLNNRG